MTAPGQPLPHCLRAARVSTEAQDFTGQVGPAVQKGMEAGTAEPPLRLKPSCEECGEIEGDAPPLREAVPKAYQLR